MRSLILTTLGVACAVAVTGCVLAPRESAREQQKLDAAGAPYVAPREQRRLPDLPADPTWEDVLRRALLANGELEAAWQEWAMAVTKITQAGSYPTQPVELGFEYMFSAERMKSFDRLTVDAGFMDATQWPGKAYQSAKVAWRDAQAAGEKFRAAKFELQSKVLTAWANYALQAERVRIQEENVRLLQLVSDTAASRVRAGGAQQEQLRADVQLRLAQNELGTMRATLRQQQARLNAMLVREPDAPLPPPASMPAPRPFPTDDAALLAAGVKNNPELAALDATLTGRSDAIERAKMEYIPDFNLRGGFTGSVEQFVGAALVLPTELPKIRAMVDESRADLRRVIAMRDQARSDKAGEFVATLAALRDFERRRALFDDDVLPLAQRSYDLARQGYASGTVMYLDLIEAQRTLLETRLMAAEARAMREQMLAELEMLAGVDVETLLNASTTQPTTTQPAATRREDPREHQH
jgi:outer membrane protein TolC